MTTTAQNEPIFIEHQVLPYEFQIRFWQIMNSTRKQVLQDISLVVDITEVGRNFLSSTQKTVSSSLKLQTVCRASTLCVGEPTKLRSPCSCHILHMNPKINVVPCTFPVTNFPLHKLPSEEASKTFSTRLANMCYGGRLKRWSDECSRGLKLLRLSWTKINENTAAWKRIITSSQLSTFV